MAEIYNHVQVFPDLATSGVIPGACFSGLSEQGYQLVINLLPKESEHAVKDEPEQLARLGIEYVYIPVDFAAPSQQDFDAFAAAMDAGAEQKVWVHCAANYRVSAFVSLYNQMRRDWSREEADALVAKLWQPNEIWSRFMASVRSNLPVI
jgi:protein tyrosine phosphatase (PTP) superfamily phosphohydrolase (DUF442 family)